MKTLIKTMLFALLGVLACGCTQNNGHIGHWFGQWKLEALEIDGAESPDYTGNQFWAFQNDVVQFQVVWDDGLSYGMHYATWKQDGDKLFIDFRHTNGGEGDESMYAPPAILGMEAKAVNELAIKELSSSRLVLEYDAGDRKYIYRLRKWG
ncbi:MAG: lipocalin-like domain-containing protein [Clostridium sp.]|nr:lipocalin-like domain-containing protein [Clostridium sp.]